jgi:hypothetical protein
MKAKTIRKVLKKKIDEWIESIEHTKLREEVKRDVIVTGGCIASMLLKEPVNDYDLYFKKKETVEKLAKYYIDRFKPKNKEGIKFNIHVISENDRVKIMVKSAGIASEEGTEKPYQYFEQSSSDSEAGEYIGDVMDDPGEIEEAYEETKELVKDTPNEEENPYRPVFVSTNAIMLSGKIQLVLRFFGEPDEIHKNYDFTHCTNYYTRSDDHLELRKDALECLLTRELIYQGSKYPVCSIFRLRKFIKRGWTINAGQILKAIMQISELDLTNIEVLQDQLTGVDCAYFMEVLGKLKEKDPKKVNVTYLVEIIDRMF